MAVFSRTSFFFDLGGPFNKGEGMGQRLKLYRHQMIIAHNVMDDQDRESEDLAQNLDSFQVLWDGRNWFG